MLKRPRLGRKKTQIAVILLPVATVLQSRITSWEVKGKKTFSVLMTLLKKGFQSTSCWSFRYAEEDKNQLKRYLIEKLQTKIDFEQSR